jgi:hypothetical protein
MHMYVNDELLLWCPPTEQPGPKVLVHMIPEPRNDGTAVMREKAVSQAILLIVADEA